jgi:predicted RNA binding protein YcfA (HicA-like mRNA interferase family)
VPRAPRLTAAQAEALLLKAGFLAAVQGSHRIYEKRGRRIVVPFHGGATLHPKVIKQVLEAIEETSAEPK